MPKELDIQKRNNTDIMSKYKKLSENEKSLIF